MNEVAVTTPDILTLSKFVCPSTSKLSTILTKPPIVEMPDPPLADPVIVTIPADTGVTDKLSPKLIVPAIPISVSYTHLTLPTILLV